MIKLARMDPLLRPTGLGLLLPRLHIKFVGFRDFCFYLGPGSSLLGLFFFLGSSLDDNAFLAATLRFSCLFLFFWSLLS